MNPNIRRYRKKPAVVEAMQWDSEGVDIDIIEWAEYHGAMIYRDFNVCGGTGPSGEDWGSFEIGTLEGVMEISPYDFVIKGVAGEFYPCKPDIFKQTYEVAE